MTVRVVLVIRAVYPPDGPWRIITKDKNGNTVLDEPLEPDAFIKEAVGARPYGYFRAERSVDGWQFKSWYRGNPLYWHTMGE